MNRYLLFILALLVAPVVMAQALVVEAPVEIVTKSMYASRNPRTTSSGKYCGVLMVHSTVQGLRFDGPVEGDVDYTAGIYYVYLRPGSKKLKVVNSADAKVEIALPDIQSKTTYEVTIYEKSGRGFLTCTSDPSGADVELVTPDKTVNIGRTPLKGNVDVVEGVYVVRVSKRGFNPQIIEGVRIRPGKTTKLGNIKLRRQ